MRNPKEIQTRSLSSQVYTHLRQQLMAAQLRPGDRLKIRSLAKELGTSETPVREALLQLVNDGALEMKPGYYIRVRQVSLREYMEIRKLRLLLEPYAAAQALPQVDDAFIDHLARLHDALIEAEDADNAAAALTTNYDFHFSLYRRSEMPQLIEILERLWIQIGPLLSLLYPENRPVYEGEHQHLHLMRALRRNDAEAAAAAIKADMIEGGQRLLLYLEKLEAGDQTGAEVDTGAI